MILVNTQQKEKGFTIIEVVLVLAIAGLIFMMVFIALPALQRNQRDTQRKNDLSRIMTGLTSFVSNNRGSLPSGAAGWNSFESSYLLTNGDSFIDPSGAANGQTVTDRYNLSLNTNDLSSTKFADAQNIIYYAPGNICDPTNSAAVTVNGAGARKVALRIVLEGGGVHCMNN